jgi:hypothetical protein
LWYNGIGYMGYLPRMAAGGIDGTQGDLTQGENGYEGMSKMQAHQ